MSFLQGSYILVLFQLSEIFGSGNFPDKVTHFIANLCGIWSPYIWLENMGFVCARVCIYLVSSIGMKVKVLCSKYNICLSLF